MIILVDALPEGCCNCHDIYHVRHVSDTMETTRRQCNWLGHFITLDMIRRDCKCSLRLRSRYVELPEGWERDDSESPKATLTMMISENFRPSSIEGAVFVRRIDKEGTCQSSK